MCCLYFLYPSCLLPGRGHGGEEKKESQLGTAVYEVCRMDCKRSAPVIPCATRSRSRPSVSRVSRLSSALVLLHEENAQSHHPHFSGAALPRRYRCAGGSELRESGASTDSSSRDVEAGHGHQLPRARLSWNWRSRGRSVGSSRGSCVCFHCRVGSRYTTPQHPQH